MKPKRPLACCVGLIAVAGSLLLMLSPRIWAQPAAEDAALQNFFQALLRDDPQAARQILHANTNLARVLPSVYFSKLPLLVATSTGHLEIVDQLLKLGADVNAEGDTWATGNQRLTALEISIWYNHPAVCKRLLEAQPDLNHRSPFKGGALHIAFANQRQEMAGWLLNHGANPLLLGGHPAQMQTAFAMHIAQGDGKLVPRMLESAGPAATGFLRTNGTALLSLAATRGQLIAVEALFQAGVSLPTRNSKEPPLLQTVALAAAADPLSYLEIRNLLQKHGADYDVFAATAFGDVATARQLVSTNQNLATARDVSGATPLHWAVQANRPALTSFWLESGAATGATNFAGQTPTHLAAASGFTEQLNLLLAANAPLDRRDTNGWTPLDAAIQAKQTATIRMLMSDQRVAPPKDRGLALSLHEASASGNIVALTVLVNATNIEARNELGFTPFHLAIQKGQLGAAAFLVDQGADVNARDPEGNTVLHQIAGKWTFSIQNRPSANWLARRSQDPRQAPHLRYLSEGGEAGWPRHTLQAAGFLLACRADASQTNQAGKTPAQLLLDSETFAFESERGLGLKLFGEAGANLEKRDTNGDTALHRAARELSDDKVAELIAAGLNLNATNNLGRTPVHAAVEKMYSWGASPLERLLAAKPDVNAPDLEGLTPLHLLASSEGSFQKEAVQALLKAGANPNLRDKAGRTPAHIFLTQEWPWRGAEDCLPLLAATRADLSAPDPQGRTPLHYYAALSGERGNLLFFTGGLTNTFTVAAVDFNAQDQRGDTPLHVAARQGGTDVFEWLCRAGAKLDLTNRAGETPRLLALQTTDRFNRFRFPANEDIHAAAQTGDVATLRRLLQSEPRLITSTNQAGETPLRLAARNQQTNAVATLLGAGAVWDEVSAAILGRADALDQIITKRPSAVRTMAYGKPLLHLAAESGNATAVETLLKAGAKREEGDLSGRSALGAALQLNRTDVVRLLRASGAAENLFDGIVLDRPELMPTLMEQSNFSTTQANATGLPPLHTTVAFGRENVLRALLEKPLDPNQVASGPRWSGLTALHVAAACNRTNEATRLLQQGANPRATDDTGFQPLHYAAASGAAEMLALLLQHKVSPDEAVTAPAGTRFRTRLLNGDTALHFAALGRHTNAIAVLLTAGANVNATNAMGATPLSLVQLGGPGGMSFGYTPMSNPGWALRSSLPQMGVSNLARLMPFAPPPVTQSVIAQLEQAGARKIPPANPFRP
jgi:serine/threonine-protein phosphatase 6 regulatory ankyrin repeat subunit B